MNIYLKVCTKANKIISNIWLKDKKFVNFLNWPQIKCCFTIGKGRHMLNWPVRFNICLGVARGLFYLHEIAQPRIIHRDIKASNILLDKYLQARIADFGLARLFPEDQTHITTMHIAGTKWVRIHNFNLSFNNQFFSMQSSYINKIKLPFN